MNKNARKLIPAVAMLLVSASMLSTASYAWFSMNNKVTAGGMKVQAVAPGNLEISNSQNGTYANAANSLNTTQAALAAVSSISGLDFYMAKPSTVNGDGKIVKGTEVSKLKDANSVTVNSTEVGIPTYYSTANVVGYVDHVFYLKSTTTIDQYVTIDSVATKISITGDNQNLAKAIRFAVLDGTDTTVKLPELADENDSGAGVNGAVYTQNDAYNTEGKAWATSQTAVTGDDSGTLVSATGEVKVFDTASAQYLFKLTKDTAKAITIRIWLEGESQNCVKDNINSADISVSVIFTIK